MKGFTLEFIEEKIQHWENIKQVYYRTDIKPNDDLATCTYKLYFRMTDTVQVTNTLRKMGFSIPGIRIESRKITTADVSSILQNKTIPDIELQNIVRDIFLHNKMYGSFKG